MNVSELQRRGPMEGLFQIGTVIGRGGTATVVEVEYLPTGKVYAAKLVEPSQPRDAIRKEARAGLLLRHENILPTYYYNLDNDPPFILQLRANRQSLHERLGSGEPLPIDFVARIITETSRGVAYAHSQGIAHRDLKPTNILLHEHEEDKSIVRVGDWGIAVRTFGDPSILTSQVAQGTAAYSAPEVVNRNAGEKSDVYSAGVIAYEMLVGMRPFEGEPGDLIVAHRTQSPPRFKAILGTNMDETVANLENVVRDALKKAPEDRPTMEEFGRRFQAVVGDEEPQEQTQPLQEGRETITVQTRTIRPAEPGATEVLVSDLPPTAVYTSTFPEGLDAMREEEATLKTRLNELRERIRVKEAGDTGDPLLRAERENPMIERAKEILGRDFLGVEAMRKLESVARELGHDISFVLDGLPDFGFTERDLEIAKMNGEMLVLRPGKIASRKRGVSGLPVVENSRISLGVLRNIFNGGQLPIVDETQKRRIIWEDFHRISDEDLRNAMKGDLVASWSMVKKDAFVGIVNIPEYAEELESNGAISTQISERNSVGAAWDTLVYYYMNQELLLKHPDLTYVNNKFGIKVSCRDNSIVISIRRKDALTGVVHSTASYLQRRPK